MKTGASQPYPNFATAQLFPGMELSDNFKPDKEEMEKIVKIFQEALKQEPKHGCLAPLGDGNTCGAKAIGSHTLGLSRELEGIADRRRMVRSTKLQLSAILDFGSETFQEILIKKASAFLGFCNSHDTNIFLPIDERPWLGSDEQNFLLAYRGKKRYGEEKVRGLFTPRKVERVQLVDLV